MRSNRCLSARLCRVLDAGRQPPVWKAALGFFLAITLSSGLFAVSAEAQSARTTYVSGVGRDTNPCTAAAPCLTLQTALARTAPGGQIYPLDSANYGYVTIDKAVSILAGRGATGVLATSSISGVNIHAGPSDTVNLQGLDIDGAGSGASGIQFNSGGSLNIQDSVIRGFTNGINFQPSASSTLSVSETLITNNSTGINLHGAAASTAVLNDVQIVANGTGIAAAGASSTAAGNVTVQSSVLANNKTVGVGAGAFSTVYLANSTITGNAIGLQAQTTSSLVQVSNSTVTGNSTAWQATNGGQVLSAANNSFGGNTGGDTAPPPVPPPPPTSIAKNIRTDFGATCNGVANDNAAFTAFNTWGKAQTLPIILTIPSGSVCMFTNTTGSGNWFARGIKNLLVMGYGATLSDNNGTGNGFFMGGFGLFNDNVHSSRVATVAAGATTITLQNPSQAALFNVGNWALMTGLDMMGYGYPTNPAFFEYVKINAINSSTGAITFSAPLKNTYKSTWPLYWAGNDLAIDQGGPATLYALDSSWDTQVEYRGLTISQAGQTYANGRSVTYRDVTFTGTYCGVPTQNMLWQVINTNMSACNMEVDKLIDTLAFNGGTIRQILFQSASVNSFTMNGTTVTSSMNGTPINSLISNATIAFFQPGAIAYGVSKATTCTSCVLSEIAIGGFLDSNANTNFTMSNGVMTVPNSHGPVAWAVPGANLIWSGQYQGEGAPFVVTDVTQDVANTYIHTSLSGGFPTLPLGGGTNLAVKTHPAPKFTCTNCTGSADAVDLSQAPVGAPLWSYSKRTYTGNTPPALVPIWGALVSATLSVTTAYSGASPLNMSLDGPFVIGPNGNVTIWGPTINPKITGLRTVLPDSVSNAQIGDSLTAPGAIWLLNNQITPQFNIDISGQTSGTWPVVTVEIITNQGFQ